MHISIDVTLAVIAISSIWGIPLTCNLSYSKRGSNVTNAHYFLLPWCWKKNTKNERNEICFCQQYYIATQNVYFLFHKSRYLFTDILFEVFVSYKIYARDMTTIQLVVNRQYFHAYTHRILGKPTLVVGQLIITTAHTHTCLDCLA